MLTRLPCYLAIALLAVPAPAGEPAADWPQWRGPHRDGQVDGPGFPERLDESALQQAWRVTLGPSYSGPLVIGDRVFVTETQDEEREVVRALDRATGRELWSTQWEGSLRVPFFARANGDWIRSTPAYDDGRLYVAGMRDVLVCLDADDGSELWRVDFVKQFKTAVPSFGCVCSPLVKGDYVYLQAAAAFVKLDKRSGEVVWRTLEDGGGMFGSAFSSPVYATIAGRPQLVVQTRTALAGVDPESGQMLWSQEVPAFRGMNILTPTVVGDAVFTSAYGGRSFLYALARAGGGGDGYEVKEAWANKAQGYMSSPLVIGGQLYLHLRNQRLTCIDLATGETRWTTKPFGAYWSMVADGDRILALDERGKLLLFGANPERFELLDTRTVSDESTWAHLAVRGEELFIRELHAVTAFRWARPAATQARP